MDVRANHRQQEILDALRQAGGSMRVQAIAATLKVTDETVRRNLRGLARDGLVEKTHGGVRLQGAADNAHEAEGDFHQRFGKNTAAKRRIARTVADMIPDGSSLFLDIGSTTAHIADALRERRGLLIVTNSVYVAWRLATVNDNRVFMAGGELRAHDGGAFGHDAMEFAANFNTDYAVFSSAGITAAAGFSLFDLEEARFSRLIMKNAGRRIIAADASKFGVEAPIVIGEPSLVDCLVTEAAPPPDILAAAEKWGMEIVVSDPG
ncbi:DeoR/GlpR family DNA-binding transcription regulator [Amaricoccus tamworthensis]|uniref:DeoR/GlpR family DNA-binding transcription regulator n=1 Tax=Amaricoccus tamworthensis TaxID=57002 RepID=UPI003C7AE187